MKRFPYGVMTIIANFLDLENKVNLSFALQPSPNNSQRFTKYIESVVLNRIKDLYGGKITPLSDEQKKDKTKREKKLMNEIIGSPYNYLIFEDKSINLMGTMGSTELGFYTDITTQTILSENISIDEDMYIYIDMEESYYTGKQSIGYIENDNIKFGNIHKPSSFSIKPVTVFNAMVAHNVWDLYKFKDFIMTNFYNEEPEERVDYGDYF